ncbi:TPA: hypothetical protein ACUBE1_004934, partial [Escherichia coli]
MLLLAGDLSSSCSAIALNPDATQGVTPSGPLCCAAHRAGSRLAPPLRGANALQASASFASALLCYPWIVQLSGALAVTVR